MKVGAATAPVSNAVEGVICQHILYKRKELLMVKSGGRVLNTMLLKMIFYLLLTLVLGWMMVRPCLLMAILTISGKFGSDVC